MSDEVIKVDGAVALPAGCEAKSEIGEVVVSIGCCAMPQGVEAHAESGESED